ncbi:MAG: arylsulfatase [Paludibacter sp.]|nr:arylsulfatase [Paludibacter sp.]MDD4199608.1 arylsulfatase [Paludibacter sp.]MDD4428524.1 arylsulfatase [Paludibacter sp.]
MKIKIIFSSIGATLLASASCAQQKPEQPNVIYILADDLGYGDLSCYGQEIIQTPHIDALAANGMRFTQHYAGSTVSAPSRSSLMTGLHTGHTFIRGNKEHQPEGQYPLPGNTYTIAKMFQEAGYVTGAFGKWGLGYPGSEGDPNSQGFNEFFGYNCQRLAHHYFPDHLYHNQEKIILEGNQGMKKEQYAPDIIQQKMLEFIRANAGNKFFLFVPYIIPHAELVAPDDSIYAIYKGKIEEIKSYKGVDGGEMYKKGPYASSQYPRTDFAAMVTRLDMHVGQVVAELKRLGIADNTLIIFTSDNGPHREGGADPDFFKSYGPFRGVKRDLFEGGIRVPMIACWPGKINAGTVSDHCSAFWDMMPTFHELSGSTARIKTDGISMLPTLLSRKKQKKHPYLYWEFHEQGGKVAVRKGHWKGVKLSYKKYPDGRMLLFDLSTDLREENDVAHQHPEIVNELEKIMKEAHVPSEVFN